MFQALSSSEMLGYITNCGKDGYSAATDVFLDHHLVVVLNRKYRQTLVKSSSDSYEQRMNMRMDKIRSIVKRDNDDDDNNDDNDDYNNDGNNDNNDGNNDDESPPGSAWKKSETNDYDIDLSGSGEEVFAVFKYTALSDMCQGKS